MSLLFQDIEPKSIWQHFKAINAIPRASTKEEQIIQYMIDFGNFLGLETIKDTIGNVIIKKPATIGKENSKTVVLQGHLDMVHQKNVASKFDFNTQGIDMYIDGDWVKAKETTLGADNGIGVAAIMAVLSSNNIEHPAIEALFTIDEEMGMTGAMALTNNLLKGSLLLNLDSEEDDEITIGCAGGVDVEIKDKYNTKSLEDSHQFYEIIVQRLTGGHSGVDIHLNRANAIKVLAEYINHLSSKIDVFVHSIEAGTLTNVIPRDSVGVIAVNKNDVLKLTKTIQEITKQIKVKYEVTDALLTIKVNRKEGSFLVSNSIFQKEILQGILKIPNGVFSMTKGIETLVQTSNNIAKIRFKNGTLKIACHARSSVDSERDEIVGIIKKCFPNATVSENGSYPGWEPQPNSRLLQIAKSCYKKINGVEPAVKSIHAGLECGILSGIFPNMEMISFGPNILGAHSPEERLQISSTQKFWKFLIKVLKEL